MKARCDHCRHTTDGTRQSYRLNRNLQPTFMRLCVQCRAHERFTVVDHYRTPLEAAISRGGDR